MSDTVNEHFPVVADIPDDAWDEEESAEGKLLTSIVLCGVPMFLEAYEIVEHDDGSWNAVEGREDGVNAIWNAVGGDKRWYWFERKGKKYALVATPYCD